MSCAETTALAALAARLADIRIANGYESNIGERIYDEEPEPEEAPHAPFVVLGALAAQRIDLPADAWTLTLDLDVYVDVPGLGYAVARAMAMDGLRDIERALRGNGDWVAQQLEARLVGKSLARRTAGSNYLIATATVEIDYLDED
jgi:hypothetical protein